jgi:rhamnulose-1-phosphate aldolase
MVESWQQIKAVQEVVDLTHVMWDKGWDEANGGNVSYILTHEEACALSYVPGRGRKIELEGIPEGMRGKYVLVTATGSFFREIRDDVSHLLGIIYIPLSGNYYEIAAGLENSMPTSELQTHLAAHAVRLEQNSEQRVVMHNHATNVLTFSHAFQGDEREMTRALWRIITEAMVLFPDGIGFVPWCLCGTQEIADKTLEKMRFCRIVIWEYHGVFTTGTSMHDAYGLLETVDKCCEVWLKAHAAGNVKGGISDDGLRMIANHFNVTPHKGFLN